MLQLHNKCARVQDAVYSATDAVSTRALCKRVMCTTKGASQQVWSALILGSTTVQRISVFVMARCCIRISSININNIIVLLLVVVLVFVLVLVFVVVLCRRWRGCV